MTIFSVPDMASGRNVEVPALVNLIILSPGALTKDQKTIINQVYGLLTSFFNSPDFTDNIANLRNQNTELSVKNDQLATRNLTL